MERMLKSRFVLLVSLLLFGVVQNSFGSRSKLRRLVSPELLEHANLKILWENELPLKKAETLENLLILDSRIYAISDRNYMVSMNRENGNMIFGGIVAPDGLRLTSLMLYVDNLISIAGTKLIEIDPDSGAQRKFLDVDFGIVCPIAYNSSFLYLGGVDKRLHTLRAEGKVQIFEVAAENESMITSIIADENFVIFTTAAGNVISIEPDIPRKRWQFDAAGGIAGPIIRDGRRLFFASKDTSVYRVDMVGLPEKRRLVWKYRSAGVLDRAPRVTPDVVYQCVRNKGVTAIDKESGKFMWSVPGGVDLLAQEKGKAYVITKNRRLVVMDNLIAKKLYSVNFADVSRYTANIADSKLYIADKDGRIACLQPID